MAMRIKDGDMRGRCPMKVEKSASQSKITVCPVDDDVDITRVYSKVLSKMVG
jgi:hypothetical protein